MNKIIFVCTGNTCRSPMAEMITLDLFEKNNINNIEVISRGLSVFSPSPISKNAKLILDEHNIKVHPHTSTLLSNEDLTENTLILTMTRQHKDLVLEVFSDFEGSVYTLSEYSHSKAVDITDPFGGSMEIYRKSFCQIQDYIKKIIKNLPIV